MSREDQIQESNVRWRKALGSLSEKGDAVSPPVPVVQMDTANLGNIWVEHSYRNDDLIIHLFVHDGVFWTKDSRSVVARSIIAGFGLEGKEDKLQITWEQEVYSWCVIIRGIAAVTTPPKEMLDKAFSMITKEADEATQVGG